MSKCKVAAALLAVVALAACSGSDKKPVGGTSGKTASAAPGTTSASSSDTATGASLQVLAAEVTPGAFTLDTTGTQTVPAGLVPITLTNTTTAPQQVMLVRIRDSDFASFRTAVLAQGAAVATSLGDVAYTSPAVAPGKSSTETATLTAGVYALLSPLTASDGKTYAEHGMLTRLEVTPSAAPTGAGSSATSASSVASASGSSSSSGSSASQSSSSSSSSSGTPGSSSGSTSSSSP